jgi:hypothetical protein
LSQRTTTSSLRERDKEWLVGYLEEIYRYAEYWGNRAWTEAVGFERERLWDVLRCVGLLGCGFAVAGVEEVRARVVWGRSGDWRGDSEPMGRPVRGIENWRFGWVGKERDEALRKMGAREMSAEPMWESMAGRYDLSRVKRVPVVQGAVAES